MAGKKSVAVESLEIQLQKASEAIVEAFGALAPNTTFVDYSSLATVAKRVMQDLNRAQVGITMLGARLDQLKRHQLIANKDIGFYNGLEYAMACMEGREPNFYQDIE